MNPVSYLPRRWQYFGLADSICTLAMSQLSRVYLVKYVQYFIHFLYFTVISLAQKTRQTSRGKC